MTDARGLRPRRSVDYRKPVAPGTPNWLRLSSRDAEQDVPATHAGLVEKENSKPAPAGRHNVNLGSPKRRTTGKGRGLAPKRDAAAAEDAAAGGAAAAEKSAKRQKQAHNLPAEPAEEPSQTRQKQNQNGAGREKQQQPDSAAAAREEQQSLRRKVRKSVPARAAEKAQPVRRKTAPEVVPAKRSHAQEEAGPSDKGRKRARADGGQPAKPEAVTAALKAAPGKGKPAASAETWSTTTVQKSDGNTAGEATGKAGISKATTKGTAAAQAVSKPVDTGKGKQAAAAAAAIPALEHGHAKAPAQPATEPAQPCHVAAGAPAMAEPAVVEAAKPTSAAISAPDYKKLQVRGPPIL